MWDVYTPSIPGTDYSLSYPTQAGGPQTANEKHVCQSHHVLTCILYISQWTVLAYPSKFMLFILIHLLYTYMSTIRSPRFNLKRKLVMVYTQTSKQIN